MDRRQFPRVNAPIFCRPVGRQLFGRRRAADVSSGGMRLYADEAPATGDRFELDLFLPDGVELTCTVEVVWIESLGAESAARFDIGVKFVNIQPQDRVRLEVVLNSE